MSKEKLVLSELEETVSTYIKYLDSEEYKNADSLARVITDKVKQEAYREVMERFENYSCEECGGNCFDIDDAIKIVKSLQDKGEE